MGETTEIFNGNKMQEWKYRVETDMKAFLFEGVVILQISLTDEASEEPHSMWTLARLVLCWNLAVA